MDFNAYMTCCSANYQRLHKLIPKHAPIGESLTWIMDKMGQLQLQVIQKHNHTDTLSIQFQNEHASRWLATFDVQINLYHDACLAEVIALKDSQGQMQYFSHPKSRKQFPYWEKWQMNHLLCDVLAYCIKQPKQA